jgi:hypothetical protein
MAILYRKVPERPGYPARSFRSENTQYRRPFDGKGIVRSEDGKGRREGEGKEQDRIQQRADQRGDQRRAPPGLPAELVEDGDVEQLAEQESRAGRDRDTRRGDREGEHHCHEETGRNDTARDTRPELAVGEVRDEEGDRIGEGAIGQEIAEGDAEQFARERVLHEHV